MLFEVFLLDTKTYRVKTHYRKSTKFSLHSMFAPRSKTTLMPFLLGHKADSAGLSIFSIILRFNLAMTNNAPVLPAEITISTLFLHYR